MKDKLKDIDLKEDEEITEETVDELSNGKGEEEE
jgi:hypothetical protein|nr:MAG TPA: hypothetical protein [Caudoviricetes sp.]